MDYMRSTGPILDLSEGLAYELLYQPVIGTSDAAEGSFYPFFFAWLRPYSNYQRT